MKALTLHQPWASLIAHGVKSIETRSWAPPQSLIGQRMAIHAGKNVVGPQILNGNTRQAIARLFGEEWGKDIPKGAVVATALLMDARQVGFQTYRGLVLASSPSYTGWVEPDPYGDFSTGRWLWLLEDVEPCNPPVPAVGHQGLWDWRPDGKAL